MADLASIAAATAAGYALQRWTSVEGDPGTSTFYTKLEKIARGTLGEDDDLIQGSASSTTSSAAADTAAVAALNAQRSERYGFAEAGSIDMAAGGGAAVADQT